VSLDLPSLDRLRGRKDEILNLRGEKERESLLTKVASELSALLIVRGSCLMREERREFES